jgi:flagellar biosynthesis anti-sigma factor FlgM
MDMRISGAYGVYNAQPVKKTSNATSILKSREKNATDSVSFSAIANELNVARQAITELPEVRPSVQVSQLRAQLQAGTYQVSANEIAAKIFSTAAYEENAH